MNVNILFDYPSWLILLCFLCGLLYSGLLYYRNKKADFGRPVRWLLAVFRFLAVTIIALLLLAPLVERQTQQTDEPLLLFVQDNSASLLLAEDSAFYHDDYLPAMHDFLDDMGDDLQTRLYTFGEQFREARDIRFTENMTDMSEVFEEIEARYSNRNIGAAVLAGDGLYNRGINPLYASGSVTYPIYTIALGDTVPRRDVILKNVNHNRITYLGNQFPLEIDTEALQSEGFTSRLTISRDDEVLHEEDIMFTSDHHTETVSLQLEADEPGMQQYRASLAPIEDEVSLDNNYQDFFIDVIDGRQQVLILANSPHPDVGALRESLLNNDHYDVDVHLAGDFDEPLEAYDLLILHQLPSRQIPVASVYEEAAEAGTAILFIVGSQTDLVAFSQLPHGLVVEPRSAELTETLPSYNKAFVSFSLQESTVNLLDQLPPLHSPFANYSVSSNADVLLHQQVGGVVTEQPMILFSDAAEQRSGVVTGEGLWRWRLHTFQRRADHSAFDEMISRMVQFLSVQEDRSPFRVETENLVYENEPLIMEAELYDRSYELMNDPEVQVVITDEDGADFPYVMGRTDNAYRLDAGTFPPGTYDWQAEVTLGSRQYTEEGGFIVSALDLEGLQTVADHQLLHQMAQNSDADMYYPGQWEELKNDLHRREDVKPAMYTHKEFVELINMKALFFIILLLLATEWFIRKRSGSY
ncbi:MAG: hypothetical protein R6U62_03755 [Bacteroidales bacterium]